MTDNEIIKALECCSSASWSSCHDCPYREKQFQNHCAFTMSGDALDLINRQKEDIDELEAIVDLRSKRKYYQKFVTEVYQKEKGNELSAPDFDYIYELYFKQKAELEDKSEKLRKVLPIVAELKAEAIKEFVERLKEAFSDLEFEYDPKLRIVKVEEVKSLVDWALHKISIETIQDAAKDISGN